MSHNFNGDTSTPAKYVSFDVVQARMPHTAIAWLGQMEGRVQELEGLAKHLQVAVLGLMQARMDEEEGGDPDSYPTEF